MADITIYIFIALAGLASFLSPCVLPLVPPYLCYLGGVTFDQLGDEKDGLPLAVYQRVILASVFFIFGFTTIFVLLGAGASVFGQFIQQYKFELARVAGIVIILFGFHFLGILRIPLLYRDTRHQGSASQVGLIGAYIMGLAFAFGWTPCVGPILSVVISLAANEAQLNTGMLMLLVYSLGLGVPFLLAAIAIKPFLNFLKRFQRHLSTVEKITGFLLVLTGLLFINSTLDWWGSWLSINGFSNWILETFPSLMEVERWLVPEQLPEKILRKGG